MSRNTIDFYVNATSTLKDTSYDVDNDIYMSNLLNEVIDFDKVKDNYVSLNRLNISKTPSSVDALLSYSENNLIFIEFKNGNISKELFAIRRKIYDSVLIYTDIEDINIAKLREHAHFILVYNGTEENKNAVYLGNARDEKKVQLSTSFQYISETFLSYGNKKSIRYGLNEFANFCFKSVNTFTKEEFKEYIDNHI